MKKILLFIGVIAMAFMVVPAEAQLLQTVKKDQHSTFAPEHKCGLHDVQPGGVKARLLQNRKDYPNFVRQRGAITYVPIKFHLVADSDGEGRIAERNVLDMLCILNAEYLEHEIQFYIKDGFNYIDFTNLYSNVSSNSAFLKMSNEKVNNAINVYVILAVGGGTAAYYQGPPGGVADWIVIGSGYAFSESVLSHEVGHFFSLDHPFYGWEENAWNLAEWGNPVGNLAPGLSPQSPGPIENDRVNQSNCLTAADGICDTPPDFLFGFVNGGGCSNYDGDVMDVNSEIVDPMENNMMSYFQSCPDYVFTPDQVDAIHLDLESFARNYVNPGITPVLTEITNLPDLNFPPDEGEVGYESVQFQWEAVDGATHYLLEIDRLTSFSFMPQYFIATSNAKTVNTLAVDKTYHWRVRPFGTLHTCTTFSDVYTFDTVLGSNTDDIESVNNWLVRPNPVGANESIFVEMNAFNGFDATVSVYSMTGQLLRAVDNTFASGGSSLELSTEGFSSGMYIVSIQSAEGVMTKKIVVR